MIRTENPSNKIFIIVIALLLIANIGTLTLLLTADKKTSYEDHKNSSMRNYLKNEVGFTDAQLIAFDTVKSIHKSEVKPMFDEMRTRKQLNLRNIGAQNFSDSSIINAADYAALQQKNLEIKMLNNLKVIRNLCTPQQRAIFDTGFYKIMSRSNGETQKKEK